MEKATLGTSEILQQTNVKQLKHDKRGSRPSYDYNIYSQKYKGVGKLSSNQQLRCMRCAKMGHKAPDCFSKNLYCQNCKRQGHVAEVCLGLGLQKNNNQKQNNNPKAKFVKPLQNLTVEESLPINQVGVNDSTKQLHIKAVCRPPIMLDVEIDNNPIQMELDTGSAASVMSLATFKTISKRKLQSSNVRFRSYSNEVITPIGESLVEVTYGSQTHNLTVYVVKEGLSTIIGRDWLYHFKLNWKDLKTVSVDKLRPSLDNTTKAKLGSLLKEFQGVFEKKVGVVTNHTCDLKVKSDARPVFVRARPVPLALQERVETLLNRLVEEGVIEKVDFSDWATPVVPVVKPNGTIRLCADYSCSLNKQIEVPQHPLPRFEDVFSNFSGSRHFSTLDILNAFLHMPVSEATSHTLTINTHKGLFRCKRLMYGVSAALAEIHREHPVYCSKYLCRP